MKSGFHCSLFFVVEPVRGDMEIRETLDRGLQDLPNNERTGPFGPVGYTVELSGKMLGKMY